MYFLGIDIGTGGSRAVVIDVNGKVVASATKEHAAFASPQIGWAEQDPRDWWRASVAAIRKVLSSVAFGADAIGAVSFSGQMHGSVFLDEKDEVIRPALLWCDQRTEKQCGEITKKIGATRLIELVSNPAITGFTLPKILWLRENELQNWERVRCILLPKDYVRLRLTGDKASDVADSSGTLLFDVVNRRWSQEILDAMEIDKDLMPPVYESIEVTGKVSAAGAEATGLIAGTPVIAGAGDNAAGAIGMGIVQPGTVSATIGTSGVVFVVTEKPTLDLKGRTHTLCHAIPNRWHMTGVTLGAGLSLKWFRDNFGGGADFATLGDEAAKVSAGSDGAIWLPYLMGERTPHLDPHARAAFIGLTASHTRGHLVRAVMEGVAFSLRDAFEIFKSLGAEVNAIRLGGGGSHSPVWRQIQADVYGQAVQTIEADEGAALGAAILAGVGVGTWNSVDEACERTIRVAEKIDVNAESAKALDQNYEIYKRLYPALKALSEPPVEPRHPACVP
ncbi:MAG TPA: xylulokinase [Pyrinomonadaceae bacterium]|nr:xylulokinase [Acidobacteriota bacterium]HQZ97025.1 xylulokinase [Pyrinomonadaceae bacterium]